MIIFNKLMHKKAEYILSWLNLHQIHASYRESIIGLDVSYHDKIYSAFI